MRYSCSIHKMPRVFSLRPLSFIAFAKLLLRDELIFNFQMSLCIDSIEEWFFWPEKNVVGIEGFNLKLEKIHPQITCLKRRLSF